jgi:hypothetical protein
VKRFDQFTHSLLPKTINHPAGVISLRCRSHAEFGILSGLLMCSAQAIKGAS